MRRCSAHAWPVRSAMVVVAPPRLWEHRPPRPAEKLLHWYIVMLSNQTYFFECYYNLMTVGVTGGQCASRQRRCFIPKCTPVTELLSFPPLPAVRCQNLQYGEPCPTFTQPIAPPDRGKARACATPPKASRSDMDAACAWYLTSFHFPFSVP